MGKKDQHESLPAEYKPDTGEDTEYEVEDKKRKKEVSKLKASAKSTLKKLDQAGPSKNVLPLKERLARQATAEVSEEEEQPTEKKDHRASIARLKDSFNNAPRR